ncbi:MAG: hypothetical protein H0W07_04075 [Chloroflexi bacterium]|nr:hypothetical protein [Chloroflexota bacterium]
MALLAACTADAQPTPTEGDATASLITGAESPDQASPVDPRPGIETPGGSAEPPDGGPAPGDATESSPPQDTGASAAPGSSSQPGRRPGHEVFAFLNHYSLDAVEGRIEYDALSHIAFFSLDVDRDGRFIKGTRAKPSPAWAAWTGKKMSRIIEEAHADGTKVVLTAARFAWTGIGRTDTIALLSRPEARRRFAREIAAEVVARGVDGVNVDLEPVPDGQRKRFTSLIREVRAALDAARPGLELTFASIGFTDEYDLEALLAPDAADAVFIMAYQYRGRWSEIAGSVAPMRTENFGIEQTLESFLAGTTPARIILGVPYYGWQWRTATNRLNARTLPANARNGRSRPVFYEEAARLAEEHGSTFDPEEVTAMVAYRARDCRGCPLLWRQAYFDDTRSLTWKYQYVKDRGLRGVGIWALGFEGSRSGELYQILREAFGSSR